jgi:hypothetical protein
MRDDASTRLIRLLRHAYSGERAAADAYAGHWRSLRDPIDREAIRRIESDEWDHRERAGRMLASLGASPSRGLELQAATIGGVLGPLCHVSGWLLPMFGAAWLERSNVAEYATAADLAARCGRPDLAPELGHMSRVELDHEQYFRERVRSHRLGRFAIRLLGRASGGAQQVHGGSAPRPRARDSSSDRGGGPDEYREYSRVR